MSTTVRDIAWLAGLWEGEGYFTFKKASLLIGLDSTDEDVIVRAARLMKTRVYGPYANGLNKRTGEPNKRKWRVQLSGMRAAEWMMTLYAELGQRRRVAVKTALAAWSQHLPWKGDRALCQRGHALSGDNLYVTKRGFRNCRTCERARTQRVRLSSTTPMTGNETLAATLGQ